jgi:hypothetical protein
MCLDNLETQRAWEKTREQSNIFPERSLNLIQLPISGRKHGLQTFNWVRLLQVQREMWVGIGYLRGMRLFLLLLYVARGEAIDIHRQETADQRLFKLIQTITLISMNLRSLWSRTTGRQPPPLSSFLYGMISERRSVLAVQLLLKRKVRWPEDWHW